MRRFRLSTLMLLIVIAAFSIALVLQQRRATRREAELQVRLRLADEKLHNRELSLRYERMMARMQETAMNRLRRELEQVRSGGKAAGAGQGTEK